MNISARMVDLLTVEDVSRQTHIPRQDRDSDVKVKVEARQYRGSRHEAVISKYSSSRQSLGEAAASTIT